MKELRKKLAALLKEVKTLTETAEKEDRNFSDEEQASYTEKMTAIEGLKARIERAGEQEGLESWANAPATEAIKPEVGTDDELEIRTVRDRILDKPFTLADRCIALRDAARGLGVDPRIHETRAAQGANVGLGSDGGLLVGTQAIDINKQVYGAPDNLVQRVDQRTIGAGFDSAEWVDVRETSRKNTYRHGGVIGYWQGEADTIDFRNPKFEDGSLKLTDLVAIVPATDRMLRDAVGFESYATNLIMKEFKFQMNRGIVAGTGAAMPLGLRYASGSKSIAAEGGQVGDTVVFKNILMMRSYVHPASLTSSGLVWLYHPTVFPQLCQMSMAVGTAGIPVWMPANGISGKEFDTLYGYPAIPTEFLPELGNAKDIMLADLSEYLWISKGGMKSDISIHVYFTSNQTLFRFVQAANGMPKVDSATTLFEGTETVSPYVYIAERA